jgi:hypothetical protein
LWDSLAIHLQCIHIIHPRVRPDSLPLQLERMSVWRQHIFKVSVHIFYMLMNLLSMSIGGCLLPLLSKRMFWNIRYNSTSWTQSRCMYICYWFFWQLQASAEDSWGISILHLLPSWSSGTILYLWMSHSYLLYLLYGYMRSNWNVGTCSEQLPYMALFRHQDPVPFQ